MKNIFCYVFFRLVRSQSQLNRMDRPREIAEVAAWLAVQAPEYLTGCSVDASGVNGFLKLPARSQKIGFPCVIIVPWYCPILLSTVRCRC